MKDRSICFDTEMVRAVLDGRKTMTRRVMRPQPVNPNFVWWSGQPGASCPYGMPGDHLYCREAIRRHDGQPPTATYVADLSPVVGTRPPESYCGRAVWQWPRTNVLSGRFMPRWAARLFLEVTDVGVERVQQITDRDVRAEGITLTDEQEDMACVSSVTWSVWKGVYAYLWDRLNAKRGYPWASNPWVWVVSFRRLEVLP